MLFGGSSWRPESCAYYSYEHGGKRSTVKSCSRIERCADLGEKAVVFLDPERPQRRVLLSLRHRPLQEPSPAPRGFGGSCASATPLRHGLFATSTQRFSLASHHSTRGSRPCWRANVAAWLFACFSMMPTLTTTGFWQMGHLRVSATRRVYVRFSASLAFRSALL